MDPIYCDGIVKSGRDTGKSCRKFLGNLTVPYDKVLCPRCGKVHSSSEPPHNNGSRP